MKRWISATASPPRSVTRHPASLIAALVLIAIALVVPPGVFAQSTPMPIPTGPGGGGTPIYVQPPPISGTVPGQPEMSDAAAAEAKTRPLPTAPAADVGKAAPPRQITSFPEITRGVGNSKALLGQ